MHSTRRSAVQTSLLLVLAAGAADARTPAPPPVPSHCRTKCKTVSTSVHNCEQSCLQTWSRLPWREKLRREMPATAGCLAQDQRCRTKCGGAGASCPGCDKAVRGCVWAQLGLRPAAMIRCWAAHERAAAACARQSGRGGWYCRDTADVSLHTCRRRAGRSQTIDDDYRIRAQLDEDMVLDR